MSNASSTHAAGSNREPTLSTEVDDPSHPLYHHRRIVTDFDYGDILGEGSYSTVSIPQSTMFSSMVTKHLYV